MYVISCKQFLRIVRLKSQTFSYRRTRSCLQSTNLVLHIFVSFESVISSSLILEGSESPSTRRGVWLLLITPSSSGEWLCWLSLTHSSQGMEKPALEYMASKSPRLLVCAPSVSMIQGIDLVTWFLNLYREQSWWPMSSCIIFHAIYWYGILKFLQGKCN